MKLVAFDTASPIGSVALLDDEEVVQQRELAPLTHGEQLVPTLAQLLEDQGWRVADLDLVACGAGPGSFTGLRIGLAAAKGLCFATGAELQLVSSLAAMAQAAAPTPAPAELLLVPTLESRKDELFAGFYRCDGAPSPAPQVIATTAELATSPMAFAACIERAWLERSDPTAAMPPTWVFGGGAARYRELLASTVPSGGRLRVDELPLRAPAAAVGRLALRQWHRGERSALSSSAPSYVTTPAIAVPRTTPAAPTSGPRRAV